MEISQEQLNSIKNVISYLHEMEDKHYEESDEEGRSNHILNEVKVLETIGNEEKSVIKQTKEILERFGITPTQESIEAAMMYDQQNLIINLENAAIKHFYILKGSIIK